MQAANGAVKAEAGQKRTLTDRDNSDNVIKDSTSSTTDHVKEEGYTSSDSSSESSSSGGSSSTSSSSGSSTSEEGTIDSVFEEDDFGSFMPVSCAENEARFYLKRFARGSVGKCILFKGRWLTPNEFQAVSGRKSSKDWKRSIRMKGRILKEYISQGLFQEHAKTCICKICCGENVEMLKQEGEMALAAKKRRLSQADSHSIAHTEINNITLQTSLNTITTTSITTTITTPISASTVTSTKSKRKAPIKLDPVEKKDTSPATSTVSGTNKIWSPSGEVAPDDGSSNEEYNPQSNPVTTTSSTTTTDNATSSVGGVVDSSDFLPRRSRRSTHRKQNGHRTELGTFTHKPSEWDTEQVSEFLKMQGYASYSESFLNNEIDGQSLFLLREQHLMERFQMKLGPALTLIDIISRLRHPPLS